MWDTYTSLTSSLIGDVVTGVLPSVPTLPSRPTGPPPTITQVNFPNGGGGSPQSGRYDLSYAANSGSESSYKFFGVLGQSDFDTTNFGFSAYSDVSSSDCSDRYLALTLVSTSDADVSGEEVTIKVEVQSDNAPYVIAQRTPND